MAEYLQRFVRGVDALAEFWDPGISHRAAEGAIDDAGELHGPEAVRRYLQDWFDMFDDLSVVAEELVDAGDGRVVAVLRVTGRAKVSGIDTEIRFSVVYTLRDGKIVHGREYMDREQARRPWGCGGRRCGGRTWRGCGRVHRGPALWFQLAAVTARRRLLASTRFQSSSRAIPARTTSATSAGSRKRTSPAVSSATAETRMNGVMRIHVG